MSETPDNRPRPHITQADIDAYEVSRRELRRLDEKQLAYLNSKGSQLSQAELDRYHVVLEQITAQTKRFKLWAEIS